MKRDETKLAVFAEIVIAGIFFLISVVLVFLCLMVPPASVFAGPFILMFLPLWTFIPLAKIAWILKSKFGECFLLAVFFGVFGVHRIYLTRFIDGKSPPFEGEIWLRCGATLTFICFAFSSLFLKVVVLLVCFCLCS